MDYEKAFKDAIARAKAKMEESKTFDYDDEQTAHTIRITTTDIFPELAESEDEKVRKGLLKYIKDLCKNTSTPFSLSDVKLWIDWLEKQGEQKSVTDIRTWKYIADYVVTKWCGIGQYLDSPRLTTIAEELQKKYHLGQKQGEQKPAEWSEEDENNINGICYLITENCDTEKAIELISWLKSLRPQSHWRPSKEQLYALLDAKDHVSITKAEALKSLFEQIKDFV